METWAFHSNSILNTKKKWQNLQQYTQVKDNKSSPAFVKMEDPLPHIESFSNDDREKQKV